MTAFNQPLDIYNRALQLLELPRVFSTTDFNPGVLELNFAYDKIRRAMLREHIWTFATKRCALWPLDTTSWTFVPPPYAAGTYYAGQIVSSSGNVWICDVPVANLAPGVPGSGWSPFYGSLAATPWNIPSTPFLNNAATDVNPYLPNPQTGAPYGAGQGTIGYYAGDLVYIPKGDGTAMVFRATRTTVSANPVQPPTNGGTLTGPDGPLQCDAWDPSVTYQAGQLAFYPPSGELFTLDVDPLSGLAPAGAQIYQSRITLNIGNEPDLTEIDAPQPSWNPTVAYTSTQYVLGSDNQLYLCISNTTNNDPTTDYLQTYWQPQSMWGGAWTVMISPTPRAFSNLWQYVGVALVPIIINYPLTAGPATDTQTMNAFQLPLGHLREAPDDPKRGGIGWLGATSGGVWNDDRVMENGYIVSQSSRPIIYRFIADVTDVSTMDDLFCEMLASRVAQAVQPALQPKRNDLWQRAKATYNDAMDEADKINAIEAGFVQPPVDEYITCRL